jgi:hypothetical protein
MFLHYCVTEVKHNGKKYWKLLFKSCIHLKWIEQIVDRLIKADNKMLYLWITYEIKHKGLNICCLPYDSEHTIFKPSQDHYLDICWCGQIKNLSFLRGFEYGLLTPRPLKKVWLESWGRQKVFDLLLLLSTIYWHRVFLN